VVLDLELLQRVAILLLQVVHPVQVVRQQVVPGLKAQGPEQALQQVLQEVVSSVPS
jgi:hypothetical protein